MQIPENQQKKYNKAIAIVKAKDIKAIAIDGVNTNSLKLNKIEAKARQLMEKVKADSQWLRFYCKCIHQLSEGQIEYILEGALMANRPDCYFASAAKSEIDSKMLQ